MVVVVSAVVVSVLGAIDVDSKVALLTDSSMVVLITSDWTLLVASAVDSRVVVPESTKLESEAIATLDEMPSELSEDWLDTVSEGKISTVVDDSISSVIDVGNVELSDHRLDSVSAGKVSTLVDGSISSVIDEGNNGGKEMSEAGIVVMRSVTGRLIVEGKSSEDTVGISGNARDDELLVNKKELVRMGLGWIASSDEGFKVGKSIADVTSESDFNACDVVTPCVGG